VILCDNDVDRDVERFSTDALGTLASLFLGKTGISDHHRSVENQIARIYRTAVEKTGKQNSLGEPQVILRADAYMLNSELTRPMIEAIDAGIIKEVSIGFSAPNAKCSLCDEPLIYDWRTQKTSCENGHIKGSSFDGKLCYGLLNPVDAYEFSFVAVPAQRGAGVIKRVEDLSEAFAVLLTADISGYAAETKALLAHIQLALTDAEEREKRAIIIAENAKYIRNEGK
jgi:hypothetical protein